MGSYATIYRDYSSEWGCDCVCSGLVLLADYQKHLKLSKIFPEKKLSRSFQNTGQLLLVGPTKVTNDSYQLIKVIVLSTNCLINSLSLLLS